MTKPCPDQATSLCHCRRKQRGAALMVMLVIMIIGSAAFLVSSLSRSALRIQQNQNSSQILAQARAVVLGYALNGSGGSQRPGDMPYPDRLIEATPNYDGNTDSCPTLQPNPTPTGCLGRFPWLTLGMSISSPSENDPGGSMPWYAVSANLVDPANVIFNSDLLSSNPTHSWLTVRDMKGNVLSNRVAVVIIVPGSALPGQSRPTSPLGGPNQYLDSITVPAGCTAPCVPGTYKNYDLDDDYIMGDERRWIPDPNNNANQIEDSSYQFNDKLIYITIDELMPLIEKRVGNEIKNLLNTYYKAWGGDTGGGFPFAAPFTNPTTSSFTGQAATYNGLLPIDDQSYIPTWNAAPSITFDGAISGGPMSCILSNDLGGGNYSRWRCCRLSTPTSCSTNNITIPNGVTVTITGTLNNVGRGFWRPYNMDNMCEVQGRNTSSARVAISTLFAPGSVSITNSLNSNGSAKIVFRATGKSGDTQLERIEFRDILSYNSDIKTYTSSSPSCPQTATSPIIPKWLFNDSTYGNNWHQVAYYAVAQGYAPGGNHTCTAPCLTVNGQGGGNNKQAVVVMTSGALTGQTHPQNTIANYLEGENATPADFIYENKTRSSTFNDQVIVVAP